MFHDHALILNYVNKTNKCMKKYMNLLHYNPCKPPTCFGHLLWPSTGVFLDAVLICTCCFYSHTFEVCNYNYYHKKIFYITSGRKFTGIFIGINDTTNKRRKWKKQKTRLDNIMGAVRKERSRSWRSSSRTVKEWWTRVIRVLEMIFPHSNKF